MTTLQDVQHSIDEAVKYLDMMERQGKLGQWISYLLESLEQELGEQALTEVHTILHFRFQRGRW